VAGQQGLSSPKASKAARSASLSPTIKIMLIKMLSMEGQLNHPYLNHTPVLGGVKFDIRMNRPAA
jgi:hypothetical protein